MSVAQTRAARQKIKLRYRGGRIRSVSESMAAERAKAAREARAKMTKKK